MLKLTRGQAMSLWILAMDGKSHEVEVDPVPDNYGTLGVTVGDKRYHLPRGGGRIPVEPPKAVAEPIPAAALSPPVSDEDTP